MLFLMVKSVMIEECMQKCGFGSSCMLFFEGKIVMMRRVHAGRRFYAVLHALVRNHSTVMTMRCMQKSRFMLFCMQFRTDNGFQRINMHARRGKVVE